MAQVVWKFQMDGDVVTRFQMPKGAQVMTVANQGGKATIWALVDTEVETESRRFVIVGTGRPIPGYEIVRYVGTIFESVFVWHVFEVKP